MYITTDHIHFVVALLFLSIISERKVNEQYSFEWGYLVWDLC